MVGSELTGGVSIGDLLVFLGCWRLGPYADPDQQGDYIYFYFGTPLLIEARSVARLFWYYFLGDYFAAGAEIVPQKGLCNRNKTSA
jgi:hypothetical protein